MRTSKKWGGNRLAGFFQNINLLLLDKEVNLLL